MKKNVIAVIPARGNSKRIPGKNYKKFNGIPIIISTIKKLKKSKLFKRIIVSTDNKKIANISRKYGAEVPFIRPKVLSNDHASGTAVIQHAIKFLMRINYKFDYVCCVYAPNPFLQISDLKKGYKKIKSNRFKYVFSATPYLFPFFRSFTFSKKNRLKMLFYKNYKKRSQDLKEIMCDAGQFYWARKNTWLKSEIIFSGNSDVIIIPKWRYQDIDTIGDWKRAEFLSKILK
tara:strand:+ start:358 stop:1050 length:693 start_codon:yes stop_codon:yes gene_type:complete